MTLHKKINEVVVVEGYHDLAKLKALDSTLEIVITNGSEISEETLKELKKLNETRGLVLFLDPDYQGERIRRIINDYVGPTKHAFVKKSDAINKSRTKVGIEHVSNTKLEEALKNFYETSVNSETISQKELYTLGLMGKKESKIKRKKVCETLGIGLCNGKTLLQKLNAFQISYNQVELALKDD